MGKGLDTDSEECLTTRGGVANKKGRHTREAVVGFKESRGEICRTVE